MYSPKIINANRERLERELGFPLRDYSIAEVQENLYRMRGIDWSKGMAEASSQLSSDLQQFITNEILRSQIDFRYWAARYCNILAVTKELITLHSLWPSQELLMKLVAEMEERDLEKRSWAKLRLVLLKARQVGGTAISEALLAHMTFLQPKTQSLVAADHPDITLKLWQTLLRIYDNMPGWMRPKFDAKPKATNLHFTDLDSDIMYGSGNQKTSLGQGITPDCAHLTEVSTWEYPEMLKEDLFPAFDSTKKHHSLIILESTGKGGGGNYFHDLFMAAWNGQNLFTPCFVAWYHRPDRVWDDPENVELDSQTLGLASRVRAEQGLELSKGQLAWWQQHRKAAEAEGDLETFLQEFPSTIEESFQLGFKSAFSIELRTELRQKVRQPQDVYIYNRTSKKMRQLDTAGWVRTNSKEKFNDHLVVWERKQPGNIYIVAVDVSYGMDGKDYSAIEVLRVGNRMRPDEQVAEWAGIISPIELADVVWVIGHVFCDPYDKYPAMVVCETNPGSPGISTQTELYRRGYPHFYRFRKQNRLDNKISMELGWWTTPATRGPMIDRGIDAVKKGDLLVNSTALISEMDTFVNTGEGTAKRKWEHAPMEHDDRLIALFIALSVAHEADVTNVADDRRRVEEQRYAPAEKVRQFQEMDGTWDQLVARWEEQVLDPF